MHNDTSLSSILSVDLACQELQVPGLDPATPQQLASLLQEISFYQKVGRILILI